MTKHLHQLGLSQDEATIFLSLVDAPKTALDVSRATGVNRSSVYRIIDELAEKSLVHELTTDKGKLVAVHPDALELLVIEQERRAEAHRDTFAQLVPLLESVRDRDSALAVRTYSGVAGVKQMLWNELRSKTEVLMFSCGPLELALGPRWPEKYRAEIIRRGIKQRSIENPGIYSLPLSKLAAYGWHYNARQLPREVLAINHELSIHDDIISLYNSWTDNMQIGTEIKNPFLANFMRQIFEHYWRLSSEDQSA